MTGVAVGDTASSDFFVAGIGASAGGITALRTLFKSIPAAPDLAPNLSFVVVQHRLPDQPSQLARLFGSWSSLPVREAKDGVSLERGCIFVAPASEALVLERGTFATRPFGRPGPRPGIDIIDSFLESLALDVGPRAIAVVLSGTGCDGAAGAARVKQAGGRVFVQEPSTANHGGMPAAAIANGIADRVLPIDLLARELVASTTFPAHLQSTARAWSAPATRAVDGIVELIRTRAGFDLTCYKTTPLLWRIQHRMDFRGVPLFRDYEALLRDEPTELEALIRLIPIHVTEFFRDKAAWDALQHDVIPDLFETAGEGPVRAWTPACATGEEAYSLAMLLAEHAVTRSAAAGFQVFATDVSADVVARASRGIFKQSAVSLLSTERQQRFFRADGASSRVTRALRERMVFAPQDLHADPPLTGLDLVTCRNLLIYLEHDAADRVLGLLHASLRAGGYLLLGRSETLPPRHRECFEEIARDARIYRKNGIASHVDLDFPTGPSRLGRSRSTRSEVEAHAHEAALEERELPAVVVDERFHILRVHGDTSPFLRFKPGEPSLDLLQLLRPVVDLRLAARKARSDERAITVGRLVDPATGERTLSVRVTPLHTPEGGGSRLLVSFIRESFLRGASIRGPGTPAPAGRPEGSTANAAPGSDESDWSEALRLSHEELEASREELQALNEELRASNDLLNLANTNLRDKIGELETQSDVLSSGAVMTLFLDEGLRVRWFTPAMSDLFPLRAADAGRPITDLVPSFADAGFLEDVRSVMRTGTPREGEIRTREERWFLKRVRPFRASREKGERAGVAITFADITDRKTAEAAVRRSESALTAELDAMSRLHEFSRAILDAKSESELFERALDAVLGLHRADFGNVQLYDRRAGVLRIVAHRGYDQEFLDRFASVDATEDSPCGRALAGRERVSFEDVQAADLTDADRFAARRAGYRALHSTPLTTAAGESLGMVSTHFREPRRLTDAENRVTDILANELSIAIERLRGHAALRETEAAVRTSEERLRRVLETDAVGVLFFDRAGFLVGANEVFLSMTGWSREEVESGTLHGRRMTPPEYLAETERQMERLEVTGRIGPYEKELLRKDGSRTWMMFTGRDLGDGSIVEFAMDVSDRKRAEKLAQESERSLRRNQVWLRAQKEAFQSAMNGEGLEVSLGILARAAVGQSEVECRCAFYIGDETGHGLHHVVGMPDSYARRVEGFAISPESLACGLAVATGKPVITRDVLEEPRWKDWTGLAREYDYRGCWSFPVETSSGKLVGSVAMYFREPWSPTPRDLELAASVTQAAAILMYRQQEAEESRGANGAELDREKGRRESPKNRVRKPSR
jgi:two-component system CheB/CheR fusion protein